MAKAVFFVRDVNAATYRDTSDGEHGQLLVEKRRRAKRDRCHHSKRKESADERSTNLNRNQT